MSKVRFLASTCMAKRGSDRFVVSPMGKLVLMRRESDGSAE
jgi:hypothetical protein